MDLKFHIFCFLYTIANFTAPSLFGQLVRSCGRYYYFARDFVSANLSRRKIFQIKSDFWNWSSLSIKILWHLATNQHLGGVLLLDRNAAGERGE